MYFILVGSKPRLFGTILHRDLELAHARGPNVQTPPGIVEIDELLTRGSKVSDVTGQLESRPSE